jgi:hypothetical protein
VNEWRGGRFSYYPATDSSEGGAAAFPHAADPMGAANRTVRELTIELENADELFVGRAPNVARGLPPLPSGIEQIRSELGSHALRTAVATVIVLPRARFRPDLARDITRAIERYCETGIRNAENELRALRREGLRWLLFGCIVFALFVYFSERVLAIGDLPYTVKDFFGNGLFIVIAWVALWYPIDTLIYSGRPYRLEKSVLRAMHGMEIVVRPGDLCPGWPGRRKSRVPAPEPDQRLAGLGRVRDAKHPGDHQQVIARVHPLLRLALQGGEAIGGDQCAGQGPAPVRNSFEQQPRAGAAGHGEPAGQHPLAGRQNCDGEPVDPGEQFGRVGARDQRDQHERRVAGHRTERADRRSDVVAPVGHGHQRDPGGVRREHVADGGRGSSGR